MQTAKKTHSAKITFPPYPTGSAGMENVNKTGEVMNISDEAMKR